VAAGEAVADGREAQLIPYDRRDHVIDLVVFADSFASKAMSLDVPFLDHAAAHQVEYWLDYMTTAAENNRPILVAEFARMVTDRIDDAARNDDDLRVWPDGDNHNRHRVGDVMPLGLTDRQLG
jgi:hypothetical protein